MKAALALISGVATWVGGSMLALPMIPAQLALSLAITAMILSIGKANHAS